MNHKTPHLIHLKYRPDIDGLRAIAILFVIGFHAFPQSVPGGFIGVDIFFVISGFLISAIIFSSLEKERFSLAEFYVRRIGRIFPALIFVMIVCFVVGWFTFLSYDYKELAKHLASGAVFISNFVLWKESGYFDTVAEAKPLLHLWSLAVEEQFYIFWPLLLMFVWKRDWSFLFITLVIATVSFAVNIYLTSVNQTAAFYLPVSRFWELMVGGILAYVALHKPELHRSYKGSQAFIGFLCLIASLLFLDKSDAFPGYWALLPVVGTFLIISAGPETIFNRVFLSNRAIVWVGLISYPLYLWHWPILSYLRITEGELTFKVKVVAIVISFFLAWLTMKFVERPFQQYGRRKTKIIILLTLMVSVGGAGLYIFKNFGIESRVVNGGLKIRPYDIKTGYRLNQCLLDGVTESKFASFCIGSDVGKVSTVLLWGDSHAASLYQGLLAQSVSRKFNLAQFTTGGCPPVLDFQVNNRKQCQSLNLAVLSQIKLHKPETVILAAYWLLYDGKHEEGGKPWEFLSDEKIARTLQVLKENGVKNIIIMGSLPIYKTIQIKAGIRDFTAKGLNRTYNDFDFDSIKEDKRISSIAKSNYVDFVSPIDTLCTKEGCMTSISKESYIPLALDSAHLNEEGSIYFIKHAIEIGQLKLP